MEKLFDVYWNKIIIGHLSMNQKKQYVFSYDKIGIQEAKRSGFSYIIGFPELDKTYISDALFSVFSSRIPSRNRVDIDKILNKYNLKEYDEIELLRKTHGKCLTDKLELK